MVKTVCGFCESATEKITNEHVFAEWIEPLFTAGRFDMVVTHTLKRDDTAMSTRRSYGLDQRVRMPCEQCNTGWMSELESVVKPIITPMIQSSARRMLTLPDQVVIARWAVKTAMVVEYMTKKEKRYFTQAERRSVIDNAIPSRRIGAHVWLGHYASPNDGVRGLMSVMALADGTPGAHNSTFAVGQFAVQVFVERRSVGKAVVIARPGNWSQLLIAVWPPLGRIQPWPPPLSLAAQDFDALFDRFLALGAERGPRRPHYSP